jgi:hypothetical protein
MNSRILASDELSWNATSNHPYAVMEAPPLKTRWWGVLTLSGCIHSPHIDGNGLCTTMSVIAGYKIFVICTNSKNISFSTNQDDWCIEACLKDAEWEVVVIPPGGTLYVGLVYNFP